MGYSTPTELVILVILVFSFIQGHHLIYNKPNYSIQYKYKIPLSWSYTATSEILKTNNNISHELKLPYKITFKPKQNRIPVLTSSYSYSQQFVRAVWFVNFHSWPAKWLQLTGRAVPVYKQYSVVNICSPDQASDSVMKEPHTGVQIRR